MKFSRCRGVAVLLPIVTALTLIAAPMTFVQIPEGTDQAKCKGCHVEARQPAPSPHYRKPNDSGAIFRKGSITKRSSGT